MSRADLLTLFDRSDGKISADICELVHDRSRQETAGEEVRFGIGDGMVTLSGTGCRSWQR